MREERDPGSTGTFAPDSYLTTIRSEAAPERGDGSIWVPSTPLPHMLQLDALRAFAVLAVLCSHFLFYTRHERGLIQTADLAGFGVRLFFVLSGFLITGILLKSKSHCDNRGSSIWYELRHFYARRFLRIFPLFYFVLLLAFLLDVPPVRSSWIWHFSYLTNFYLFSHGWDGSINHFWSLAVEEQFYLIWPWIVLFTSRRNLMTVILIMIAVAPVFRFLCLSYTGNLRTPVLPLSCLDTLGVGALLALRKVQSPGSGTGRYPLVQVGLMIGLFLLGVFLFLSVSEQGPATRLVLFDLGAAFVGGWVVWTASFGFGGVVGKLLTAKPLIYIGTISYGIYVYHNFIGHFLYEKLELASASRFVGAEAGWICDVLLMCGVTIGLAALSWHLFESPLNSLKRYFRYGESLSRG